VFMERMWVWVMCPALVVKGPIVELEESLPLISVATQPLLLLVVLLLKQLVE
jgi:hypothetical protein